MGNPLVCATMESSTTTLGNALPTRDVTLATQISTFARLLMLFVTARSTESSSGSQECFTGLNRCSHIMLMVGITSLSCTNLQILVLEEPPSSIQYLGLSIADA